MGWPAPAHSRRSRDHRSRSRCRRILSRRRLRRPRLPALAHDRPHGRRVDREREAIDGPLALRPEPFRRTRAPFRGDTRLQARRRVKLTADFLSGRAAHGERPMWDALWRNGKLATMTEGAPFGLIEKGAIAVQDGRIAWVGAEAALPGALAACARVVHDLSRRLLTPGLVDCPNHAVYYGDGLRDFELLTQGGTRADFAVWEADEPGELAYRIADTPCREVIKDGRPVFRAAPIEFLP